MSARWHWASGVCGILLAQTVSAAEGDALPAEGRSTPEPLAEPVLETAPAPADGVAPAAENVTWQEPPDAPATPTPLRVDASAAASPADAPRERWYGWQLLISDSAALVLAMGSQSPWPMLAGYLVAPPVIHVFHGQYTLAALSAGMRVGLPLLGYAAIMGAEDLCSDGAEGATCTIGLVTLGLVIGGSAAGIDAVLANEPVPPAEQPRAHFAPQIIITERETRFGVVGSF